MGILRKAIVAGGLFAVLPMPPHDGAEQQGGQPPSPGTFAYIAAASETYADVSSFCQRQPMACDVGEYIAVTAQAKAKYSAKIIYEWANEDSQRQRPGQALATETAEARMVPLPVERPQQLMTHWNSQQKKS